MYANTLEAQTGAREFLCVSGEKKSSQPKLSSKFEGVFQQSSSALLESWEIHKRQIFK